MNRKYILNGALLIIFCHNIQGQAALTKIFSHQGNLGHKIVCYFTNEPICTRLPTASSTKSKDTNETITLLLPHVTIQNTAAQKMVQKLNDSTTPFYLIHIEQVRKPLPGLKITINYHKDAIAFDYGRFDAIHTHKGIVFSFYNKETLESLQRHDPSILKMARNNPPLIMVDCGHGGSDTGAIGWHGIQEKNLALSIGKQVGKTLQQHGYRVAFTRADDTFIPLDDRTHMANRQQADAFISLHANSSLRPSAHGIETYCPDRYALTGLSHLTPMMNMIQEYKHTNSRRLAQSIHHQLIASAQKQFPISDRCVKQATSQVLLGTDMPSVLIEIGFVTNKSEAERLRSPAYQSCLTNGICTGINKFFS